MFAHMVMKCNICGVKTLQLGSHLEEEHGLQMKSILPETVEVLNPFLCTICKTGFSTTEDLGNHFRDCHSAPSSYECSICDTKYRTNEQLSLHLKDAEHMRLTGQKFKTSRSKFMCDLCTKSFALQIQLNAHQKTKHRRDIINEKGVSSITQQKEVCRNVMNEDIKPEIPPQIKNSLEDPETLAEPSSSSGLKVVPIETLLHVDSKFSVQPSSVNKEPLSVTEVDIKKEEVQSNEKVQNKHKCCDCSLTFDNVLQLADHIKEVHDSVTRSSSEGLNDETRRKFWPCTLCSEVLKSKSVLSRHIGASHPELLSRLSCALCDQKFPTEADLTRHQVREHKKAPNPFFDNSIGPIKSEHGGLDSNRASAITRDSQASVFISKFKRTRRQLVADFDIVHDEIGAERYRCKICGKKYVNRQTVIVHIRTYHNNQSYKCEVCEMVFPAKSKMKTHIETVHLKRRNYICNSCGKSFGRLDTLRGHVRVFHSNNSKETQDGDDKSGAPNSTQPLDGVKGEPEAEISNCSTLNVCKDESGYTSEHCLEESLMPLTHLQIPLKVRSYENSMNVQEDDDCSVISRDPLGDDCLAGSTDDIFELSEQIEGRIPKMETKIIHVRPRQLPKDLDLHFVA